MNKRLLSVMLCVVSIMILLSGCASIVKGTHESIGISSSPIGATFTVDGMTYSTPAVVKLSRDKDHIIVFQKDGYESASGTITSSLTPWWLGNLGFFWGAPIGIVVDFADGATYELSPNVVNVTMQPKTRSTAQR